MPKWICTVCDYVHEGEEPPEVCPVCGAPAEDFDLLPDETPAVTPSEPVAESTSLTLPAVRDRARDRLRGICGVYPACDGAGERICQREAYGLPIGMGGAGSGASFAANTTALAALKLHTRLIGPHVEPDTSCSFLGRTLSMPIMAASTSGVSRYNDAIGERAFCDAAVDGCLQAGTLSWRGDTFFYTLEDNPALDAIEGADGAGVPIFKPRAQDVLFALIERAERAGCPAVGVDLDGCGSTNMARAGQPVFRKSPAELAQLVASTSLPFIFKGVMHPDDAEACVAAGARVIAVSNHGGRVLDSTPGVAAVLPSVVARVAGRALVTADGGVRTGYDVLKMLALGADAVLIGRDVVRAAIGGGADGVRLQMQRLQTVLRKAMLMTGCADLAAIGPQIFVERG